LFAHRGSGDGHALAGFEPSEISMTATPREIMITANHKHTKESDEKEAATLRWSEFRSDEVYRRVELPSAVDVGKTTATLKNGLLVVIAPLAPSSKSTPTKISIAQGS